jgi:hypothetical protein
MNENRDPCSDDLCDVMRHIVLHDFAIENCRELMRDIDDCGSSVSAKALSALIRYHEVERLKALGLEAGIRAKFNSR